MNERACPGEIDLDRAFSTRDPAIVAHVAGCDRCSAAWDATASALALAQELPCDVPPAGHREDLRTIVLAASDPRPWLARGRSWVLPALVIAASAAAAAVVLRRAPSPPPAQASAVLAPANHGTIHAHAGTAYVVTSDAPDEIVRLRDGTIDVDVRPLEHGQRFRVVVGADEVEVRGTSFEVVAAADHLVAVHVVHGRVEVRHLGVVPVVLAPGESWHATETAVIPPASPPPVVAPTAPPVIAPVVAVARTPSSPPPPRKVAPKPAAVELAPERAGPEAAPPRTPDPRETAFVNGWDAMRQNDFRSAAAAFAKVVALDPAGPLADDAAFWHGVSLARLRRSAEAIATLREFIEDYPSSARAGEASAMLGWLLIDANELAEARRRFDAAIADPSPAVRKSARGGLEALSRGQTR